MIGEAITKSRLDITGFKAMPCSGGGTHEPRVHFELNDHTPRFGPRRGPATLALGARYIACRKCKCRPPRVATN